ncbi:hypothetical protein M5E06_05770 [Azospirillum sp. A1-3]|uniref:hypothetical protein n=1 Tax=Azospirillum sp. A1-3 TaxID=185874 RepID=UPI0020775949|nr:hypothetical protein [Azospirillum sp. A1-3]MCM8733704.1 hypothetical protein [Azospirillum sp. A1-3]
MALALNALIKCVHNSLEEVCNEFQEISGISCDQMPEYLLTAGLYRSLKKLKSVGWVKPEANIRQSMGEAGALGRGKFPEALNASGRFDIFVYDTSGAPIGAIEVKNAINSHANIASDISRLRSALMKSPNSSTIQYVGMAFLVANGDGARKSAGDRVDTRAHNIGETCFRLDYQRAKEGIYRYGEDGGPESYSYRISEADDESFRFASCFWAMTR